MRHGKHHLSSIVVLLTVVVTLVSSGKTVSGAQMAPTGEPTSAQSLPSVPSSVHSGVIHGFIRTGTTPLSGVSVTVTDTSTGERNTVVTDVTGAFSVILPWNKSYVIRAELAAYITAMKEVLLSDSCCDQRIDFSLVLGSDVARQRQPEGRLDHPGNTQGPLSPGTTPGVFGGSGNEGDSNLHFQLLPGDLSYSGEFFVVVGQVTTVAFFAQMNDQMRLDFENGHELRRLLRLPPQNGGSTASTLGNAESTKGGSSTDVSAGVQNLSSADRPHGAIFWIGGNSALNARPMFWLASPALIPATTVMATVFPLQQPFIQD
ncbi:MAG: carboxypeptidase-like regulatory domain-containing protein [Edaphobacter sp.]